MNRSSFGSLVTGAGCACRIKRLIKIRTVEIKTKTLTFLICRIIDKNLVPCACPATPSTFLHFFQFRDPTNSKFHYMQIKVSFFEVDSNHAHYMSRKQFFFTLTFATKFVTSYFKRTVNKPHPEKSIS